MDEGGGGERAVTRNDWEDVGPPPGGGAGEQRAHPPSGGQRAHLL